MIHEHTDYVAGLPKAHATTVHLAVQPRHMRYDVTQMTKRRTYSTKRTDARTKHAGSVRVRDVERKVRKPSVRPSQQFRSKKTYKRTNRKQEEREALSET